MFLGAEMAQVVGGVEMLLKEVMLPENREDFRAATDKEIAQMTKRRFVRSWDEAAKLPQFKPVEHLTKDEKQKALRCRLVYNRKRVELGGEKDISAEVGPAKARLVAQDLKILHKLEPEQTYAATPTTDGFRLMLALTSGYLAGARSISPAPNQWMILHRAICQRADASALHRLRQKQAKGM